MAIPGLTKANVAPSGATSMSALEVSMNSRNSSDLGFSSASRSTFLQTTFPQRSWIPTSRSPDVSFAHTGRLTGSPSLFKVAPLPMLNQSDAQTEDGHAMMKSDTFHPFRNKGHAVRGCNQTVNKCVPTPMHTCTCETRREVVSRL